MPIIGLTGSWGTGKSTVSAMFAKEGAKVIDADHLVHEMMAPDGKCYKKVAKIFPDVILSSGLVDRAKLASIVFQDPLKLNKLTQVLYPEVLKEIKQQIKKYKRFSFIVLDVPLLFEAGWEYLADYTVTVATNQKTQLQRLKKKTGLNPVDIKRRLVFQMSISEKKSRADIVINNDGTKQQTQKIVEQIIDRLKRRRLDSWQEQKHAMTKKK